MLVLRAITVKVRIKRTAACWEIVVLIQARRFFREVEAKTIPFSAGLYLFLQNLRFEACDHFNLGTDRGAKTIGAAGAQLTLDFFQWLFGRERLDRMWTDGMPPRVAEFGRKRASLEIVDITDAAGSTSGNGHAYLGDSQPS